MISLLRKIRKNLVTENRVSKYFLYAVGEIVLVVIGILLALQINTWNKEKQIKVLEHSTLVNLKEDLEIQKELLKEQIDYEVSIAVLIDSAQQYIGNDANKAILSRFLFELNGRHTFKANRVTFNNIISNGSINLISEAKLQNSIIRYFQRLDYVESVVNNNNLYMVDSNFGAFVSNNPLGLELNEDNTVNANIQFNVKQKYLVFSQLKYRGHASLSIKNICNDLYVLTEELINEIDAILK
jgi:hypothetical protein